MLRGGSEDHHGQHLDQLAATGDRAEPGHLAAADHFADPGRQFDVSGDVAVAGVVHRHVVGRPLADGIPYQQAVVAIGVVR